MRPAYLRSKVYYGLRLAALLLLLTVQVWADEMQRDPSPWPTPNPLVEASGHAKVPSPSGPEGVFPSSLLRQKKGRSVAIGVHWIFHQGSGVQLSATYGFRLSPDFELGIQSAFRYYPATGDLITPEGRLLQLGYGLTLEHGFSRIAPEWLGFLWVPYFKYGLLMQINWAFGRPASATNHDTLLAMGLYWRKEGVPPFFFQAGYHISHLRYFESSSQNLSALEAGAGVVFEW